MADRTRFRIGDLPRAAFELGLARLKLNRHRPKVLPPGAGMTPLDVRQSALVGRVAYVIPRVAARLPWRADCLVQALAAERWLAREGVVTTLKLGVSEDKRPDFEAHAWLCAGDRIVTGGDVSHHVPFEKS